MREEGFYLLERCLKYPWWRLEVKKARKTAAGVRRENLHLITEVHGEIILQYHTTINRQWLGPLHFSLTEADYNNGKILSAAVIVTSPGLASTATEVILSPSVTTTYRFRPNLSMARSGRCGMVKLTLDLGPPSRGVASKSIPSARVNSALSSAMNRTLVPSGASRFFHALQRRLKERSGEAMGGPT